MSGNEKQESYSPAIDFLTSQHIHRAAVRDVFKKEAGDFLLAHEFVLSGIISCLDRFSGKKWSPDLAPNIRPKVEQVSQLSVLFLHGIDPCEVAIVEGLYGQAAALIRQQMEILGAIDEVWLDKRNSRSTPKVTSLPEELRQQYGGLSEIAHAAVPDYLRRMHTDVKGDRVGAAIAPKFNRDMALLLYRIELGLLFQFAKRQEEVLRVAYGGEAYTKEEIELFGAAMTAANKAAGELGDLPQSDSSD